MDPARLLFVLCLSSLLCLCVFCFFAADARTDEDDDAEGARNDVRALIEFKRRIAGDPHSLFKDWDDGTAPNACNWTGITCSAKHPGRVVQIIVRSAALQGSLSPHVSNLSLLQVLDISNNSFSGNIPPSLGTLHTLEQLNLCLNKFQGGIPYQLGNLSSLHFLALCSNSLGGQIPQPLSRLRELKQFNVSQNKFTGEAPSWLGAFPKLERLDLSENDIHGVIPNQLGNLSSLHYLDLHRNNLSGITPVSLSNLTALRSLDLSFNSLVGPLPTWIGSFNKLQHLGLFVNGFKGNIPDSWQNLSQLQALKLSSNRLSGTPPSWLGTHCTQLRHFDIGHNSFTSGVSTDSQPIPVVQALSNCSVLTYLGLYHNHLKGTLPSNFGSSLPNLQSLNLCCNSISGSIPPSAGNLSSLVDLNLHDNAFGGTVPPQIANLKSLRSISLQRNNLQGSIPTEVSLLNKSLSSLYLSENKLSGSIPPSIGKLVNLQQVHLDRNLLSGKIPSQIGNCQRLQELVLSSNKLSGAVPPEVAGLKSVVHDFDLSANGLRGEVPPEIAQLQQAKKIDLSGNQLSGNIASYMDNWSAARQINLSYNTFSGNLSQSMGNKLSKLQSIDLSGNNFTGHVPESLFNLSSLQFLNFSYNNFDEVLCPQGSSKRLSLTKSSFLGNPNVCGRCFGLKACAHNSGSNKSSTIVKIALGIIGGLSLPVIAGILFKLKGIMACKGATPWISAGLLMISVEELKRATDNFSDSNLVGEGNHGKVYRGVLQSGKVVAVKCFYSAKQLWTEKSFKEECLKLGKGIHRNILNIIAGVWSEDLKALVMPFLSNGNLHDLLHRREEDGQLTPLKLDLRLRILRELATGLAYLHHGHRPQVIHGHIKPENVLLDDDMTVKLSDVGISSLLLNDDMTVKLSDVGISDLIKDYDRPTESSSPLGMNRPTASSSPLGMKAPLGMNRPTASSSPLGMKGSVGYIAPEYGIQKRTSIKGDVYSFGVVTLEVITRLKPTDEMFSRDHTLPLWISKFLEGKSGEEKVQIIKNIIKTADEDGAGIELDNDEEVSAVESVLMMGLRCTGKNASMRPSMKEVELFLQSISTPNLQNQGMLPGNSEQPPLPQRLVEAGSSMFCFDW